MFVRKIGVAAKNLFLSYSTISASTNSIIRVYKEPLYQGIGTVMGIVNSALWASQLAALFIRALGKRQVHLSYITMPPST